MKTNELLRHLRKLLALNEDGMAELFRLGHCETDPATVRNWLRHDNEAGYAICPDEAMARFLEGLILSRRGPKQDGTAPAPEWPLDNNRTLKKLRIAFELKNDQMHGLFADQDQPLTKQELDALFRKPGHRNFQVCSDSLLRIFLQGLTQYQRSV